MHLILLAISKLSFLILAFGYAPDAHAHSLRWWSCALMRLLRSYCCVIFQCLAHFAGLSIWLCVSLRACFHTLSIYQITSWANFISSLCWLLCAFRFAFLFIPISVSHFLLSFLLPFYIGTCVWWRCRFGRFKICLSLDGQSYRSPVSHKQLHLQEWSLPRLVIVCSNADEWDTASVLNMSLQCNGSIEVATWKKTWCDWGGHGASVCRCILRGVDTPFVRSFEKAIYQMAFEPYFVAIGELNTSETWPATKILALLFRSRLLLNVTSMFEFRMFWPVFVVLVVGCQFAYVSSDFVPQRQRASKLWCS